MSELVYLYGGPRDGDFIYIPDAPRLYPLLEIRVPVIVAPVYDPTPAAPPVPLAPIAIYDDLPGVKVGPLQLRAFIHRKGSGL